MSQKRSNSLDEGSGCIKQAKLVDVGSQFWQINTNLKNENISKKLQEAWKNRTEFEEGTVVP